MCYCVEELSPNGLKLYQKDGLYKFTSDAILLSKFARAKNGEIAADFCAGSGIVGFNFYALNPRLVSKVYLFELQKELSEMSEESARLNALDNFFAINCRVQDINAEFNGFFSLILCNPPYEKAGAGEDKEQRHIAVCRREITVTAAEIITAASKKLKFGGRLCMVNRADRLAEIICAMKTVNIEPKRLQLVENKNSGAPYLMLIEGVLGGKSGINIMKNIVNEKFGK